ncbi:MAG TPA: glycosyltransferase family 4 protein [Micromonosporaceae bacterium]|nr:glycosyltransferase family 4 protein [Micromonosporaceae bacterium]
MRVLLLSWEYPPFMVGGLGRHVHALSTALAAAGQQVTVVTRHIPGVPPEELIDGVHVVRAPQDPLQVPASGLAFLVHVISANHTITRVALRIAGGAGYDVIHAHDWLVAHSAITLREKLDVPLVATIHATEMGRHQGWLPEDLSRSIHSVECWLANQVDRVVACSHYMRWEISRLLGVPYQRIDVVVNGVDRELWRVSPAAVTAARLRYAGSGPLIGFAGRLVYEKGVQDIIEAMPRLRAAHPGLRLVVAGDGPYRAELQDRVDRLQLRPAVSFAGFLGNDLPAVIAATDAIAVPSIYEPFGMIALEAIAAGVPVVAAETGGLKEIVEPGHTGMTFRVGDPDALARAVSRLLRDQMAAQRIVKAGHRMLDRYSWEGIAERTLGIYRSIVAEAPSFTGPAPADQHPAVLTVTG